MGYLDNTGLAYLWGKIKAKLVQPDWQQNNETAVDYVKNRPGAYDEYDVNITWDGVVGDRVVVEVADGSKLVHVSDEILTVDQINGSTLRTSNGYEKIISDITDADSILGDGMVAAFVSTPGWTFQGDSVQLTFPRAGVYFLSAGSELYVASMTKVTTVKIPQKYLDLDGYAQEADVSMAQTTADNAQTVANSNKEMLSEMFTSIATFTFDKETSGRDTFKFNAFNYYKVSDFNPAPEDVISFRGTRESGKEHSEITIGSNCVEYGLFIVVASSGACSIPITETVSGSFVAPSAGLYALYEEGNINITAGTGQFTMMSIDGLTIKSSTYGSTKKFRITVNDSGTLSAVEVTDAS